MRDSGRRPTPLATRVIPKSRHQATETAPDCGPRRDRARCDQRRAIASEDQHSVPPELPTRSPGETACRSVPTFPMLFDAPHSANAAAKSAVFDRMRWRLPRTRPRWPRIEQCPQRPFPIGRLVRLPEQVEDLRATKPGMRKSECRAHVVRGDCHAPVSGTSWWACLAEAADREASASGGVGDSALVLGVVGRGWTGLGTGSGGVMVRMLSFSRRVTRPVIHSRRYPLVNRRFALALGTNLTQSSPGSIHQRV